MKTNIRHILLGGIITAAMAVTSTAQANVLENVESEASYSAPTALMNVSIPTTNQSVIKLAQNKISASKAKKIARSRVKGGEVVDISLKKSTYKVRVIAKNGKVVDVLIDANTGRVK